MLNDTSLICQFNLEHRNDLIPQLIECVEELFSLFHYKIKKIYTASEEKVRSPGYKNFKSFINPAYFRTISFQSDYNRCDFEPETHMYIQINNSRTKGTQYVLPESLVKFTVVLNDAERLKNIENTYKDILLTLSKIPQVKMTGYSFQLPNRYGAVSFSLGILRKQNMCRSLQNLARWYRDSNTERSVIGFFNCFTGLTKEQNDVLKNLFGQENVEIINSITFFKNESVKNASDVETYFTSAEYERLCDKLEPVFGTCRK